MTRFPDEAMIHSLAPFAPVPPALAAQLSLYLDLLLRWNARMNLTAVRDPPAIVTRHFGESLFAARHLFPADHPITRLPDRQMLLDLGSGAGFPGIPLKLWAPALQVTLVETKYRKTIFLREVLRALALESISVFAGRAQDLAPQPAPLTVTLRAVERFDQILPVAASLLRSAASPGHQIANSAGARRLALLIGESQLPAARSILPGFSWQDPVPIPFSSSRILLVGTLS